MKKQINSFLLSVILLAIPGCTHVGSAEFLPQVVFRGQTEDEAFSHVMQVIKDLPYYRKHGYKVALPEHEAFKKLYENPDATIDENALKKIFVSECYDSSVFESPLKTIRKTEDAIKKALQRLAELKKNWGFTLKPKYEVILSPYGHVGSSYQFWHKNGKVFMLPWTEEQLKKAVLPLPFVELLEMTIIHEIVHIGIEEPIVKKYNLDQWQKERVVDLICKLYLKDILPNYKIPINEEMADRKIDEFVDKEAIIRDLPSAIEKFKARFP